MVVHPAVQGAITLELSGVTVPQVVALVSELYGFDYRVNDGVYQVFLAGSEQRST